jgi:amino acid transporter
MDHRTEEANVIAEDVKTLHSLGYAQELWRRMSGFSNFAVSFSIICVLFVTISFHAGFCSVGGAAIGLGWPVSCLLSLAVAMTMGQVASAFPTAGGLYHWASILGGRGWGWVTAWFNLLGLIIVLAAVNVGGYLYLVGAFGPMIGYHPETASDATKFAAQLLGVGIITLSQALVNHRWLKVTTWLTDFSGYWILIFSVALTVVMLTRAASSGFDLTRLVTFTNYSGYGPAGSPVWPRTENMVGLFALGFLLPAYTISGFDASAHVSEETVGAARHVPRGLVQSVGVAALFGWLMLASIVLAIPDMDATAAKGDQGFLFVMDSLRLAPGIRHGLDLGTAVATYLCGLAIVTSASRMTFAFARDGGLPFSEALRRVSPARRTPAVAIWAVTILAVLFTVYSPIYLTITAASTAFLYTSYVLPTALGLFAYGRTWKRMGPWDLGRWYRPLAVVSLLGWGVIMAVCMHPPNGKVAWFTGGTLLVMALLWFGLERRRFSGPPKTVMLRKRV